MLFIGVVSVVFAIAVLRAIAEMRDERQALLAQAVSAGLEAEAQEDSVLEKENRAAKRDAEKSLRQDAVFCYWEIRRRVPFIFLVDGRDVAARVVEVQPKGVVLQDGVQEHAFVPFEKLQWYEAAEGCLDDETLRFRRLEEPPAPDEDEDDEDEDDNAI